MHYLSLLALALALIGVDANIAFTHAPGSSVQAGQPFTIMWDGADDSAPVTITLKQGDPNNLQTVALITGMSTFPGTLFYCRGS
jgi:Ser-Thr-rich glycosyl-phosphatidyl-inositol-anchored membrane family